MTIMGFEPLILYMNAQPFSQTGRVFPCVCVCFIYVRGGLFFKSIKQQLPNLILTYQAIHKSGDYPILRFRAWLWGITFATMVYFNQKMHLVWNYLRNFHWKTGGRFIKYPNVVWTWSFPRIFDFSNQS